MVPLVKFTPAVRHNEYACLGHKIGSFCPRRAEASRFNVISLSTPTNFANVNNPSPKWVFFKSASDRTVVGYT